MIRQITRPTTAHCIISNYIGYLIGEYKLTTYASLGNIIGISYDSVNQFLERENYDPIDLFTEVSWV